MNKKLYNISKASALVGLGFMAYSLVLNLGGYVTHPIPESVKKADEIADIRRDLRYRPSMYEYISNLNVREDSLRALPESQEYERYAQELSGKVRSSLLEGLGLLAIGLIGTGKFREKNE